MAKRHFVSAIFTGKQVELGENKNSIGLINDDRSVHILRYFGECQRSWYRPLASGPLGQALLIVQKKDVVKLNAVATPICSLKQ